MLTSQMTFSRVGLIRFIVTFYYGAVPTGITRHSRMHNEYSVA